MNTKARIQLLCLRIQIKLCNWLPKPAKQKHGYNVTVWRWGEDFPGRQRDLMSNAAEWTSIEMFTILSYTVARNSFLPQQRL